MGLLQVPLTMTPLRKTPHLAFTDDDRQRDDRAVRVMGCSVLHGD